MTYSGKLYKCIVAIDTPQAFNVNKWDHVTVSEVIKIKTIASVTADGIKTIKDIFDELYASVSSLDNETLLHTELLCNTGNAIVKFIGVRASNSSVTYERTVCNTANNTIQIITNELSSASIQNIYNRWSIDSTANESCTLGNSVVETAGVIWSIVEL